MKLRNFVVIILAFIFAISLVSCGGSETVNPSDSTLDTSHYLYTEDDVKKCDVTIGGNDITSYTIIAAEDETAQSIAEYIAFSVKGLTTVELPVKSDSASASAKEIVVGTTSRKAAPSFGNNDFVVKVEDGKIYVFYAEGSTAYQAITSVLSESFFSTALISNGKIAIENGFELSGVGAEYITGDNEFNPFE